MRIEGLILSPSRHSTTLSKLPSTCDLNATYPLSSTISVQAASARPRERKLLSHPPQFCSDLVTWQRTCCLAAGMILWVRLPLIRQIITLLSPNSNFINTGLAAGGDRGTAHWLSMGCGLLVSSQYRTHFNSEIYHTVTRLRSLLASGHQGHLGYPGHRSSWSCRSSWSSQSSWSSMSFRASMSFLYFQCCD